jgi:hypothetical protein
MAGDNVAFLLDPLSALALVDDASLRWERLRIVPTIERGTFRTIEVPDASPAGVPMRVATAVDAGAARRAIVERVTRV